ASTWTPDPVMCGTLRRIVLVWNPCSRGWRRCRWRRACGERWSGSAARGDGPPSCRAADSAPVRRIRADDDVAKAAVLHQPAELLPGVAVLDGCTEAVERVVGHDVERLVPVEAQRDELHPPPV